MKPYNSKSLKSAVTAVRQLRKQVAERDELLERFAAERILLAKLACETPQFFNPLDVMYAKNVRDNILKPSNIRS